MSTRSNIARQNADGTIDYIYCHSDGYLSHNGSILLSHYQDAEKVDQLIALGDLSFLAPEIGGKHSFEDRNYDVCMAYGRDRGEIGTEARKAERLDKYIAQDTEEFCYIYTKDGEWVYRSYSNPNLHLLTAESCKE
jgi:hypothetical protein